MNQIENKTINKTIKLERDFYESGDDYEASYEYEESGMSRLIDKIVEVTNLNELKLFIRENQHNTEIFTMICYSGGLVENLVKNKSDIKTLVEEIKDKDNKKWLSDNIKRTINLEKKSKISNNLRIFSDQNKNRPDSGSNLSNRIGQQP